MADNTTDFEAITIGLASSDEIRSWSHGEVKKPETINYRTYKPERDGLFCERIFGPSRDWECHCGKYKKVKFKGIVCDRCGVEVTRAKVRRERMGHIELAAPVCHSWYLKGVPSPISLLLDMSRRLIEEVVYFASYIVTEVDSDKLLRRRSDILSAVDAEKEEIATGCDMAIQNLRERYEQGLRRAAERRAEAAEEIAEGDEEAIAEDLPEFDAEEGWSLDENEEGFEAEFAEVPNFYYSNASLPEILTEEDLSRRVDVERDSAKERISSLESAIEKLFELTSRQLISEMDNRQLRDLLEICEKHLEGNFTDLFKAGLGAEAVYALLADIDLDELAHDLRKEIDERTGARRARAVKRLRVVEAFRKSRNRPEWMILSVVPVLPPELRPMVQLDGGRFATSDLNDLYRRVINRNNRLRRIIEINAPESIINHERRLLQEAVDALIDNGRRSRPVTGSNRRPLKSLSDMLKGKEGRFRKNLLGKRVDYSGRSVIVVGPELKLNQCGLPREMALELFKPFVMQRLVEQGHTTNIKTAKRMVDRLRPEVWDALEEVIEGHPVLLNRAPTLHRLGIQAFEPVLIGGKAIQLHPMCCEAFNADFDGDQMAVHVPLSAHAQAEARLLMLASRNLFKPADGAPITAPKYDIVLGCYYMTQENPTGLGAGKAFESAEAVLSAYEHRKVDLHATIKARLPILAVKKMDENGQDTLLDPQLSIDLRRSLAINVRDEHPVRDRAFDFVVTDAMVNAAAAIVGDDAEDGPVQLEPTNLPHDKNDRILMLLQHYAGIAALMGRCTVGERIQVGVQRQRVDTTVGRVMFNSLLPLDMQFLNKDIAKEELGKLVDYCYNIYGQARTAQLLDTIKAAGFKMVTRSGLSICMNDTNIITDKATVIARTEREVRKINDGANKGHIIQDEREQLVLEKWLKAREEVADQIMANIDSFNSIWMMTNSGARANRSHISQISGMRGLMSDPFGRLIEDMPVKNNFNDGLNVLEYFVSTHGARKGLADTALRTADAGYLTRRLVDVSQDVMVRAQDCGTTDGVLVYPFYEHELHCPSCGKEDYRRKSECAYCGTLLPATKNNDVFETLEQRINGRTAAVDIVHPATGEVIVEGGHEVTERLARAVADSGISEVIVRSPLTCELRRGICAKCYGRDLARRRRVEIGTAIGIIAAQSIGEPGTQLTMRTFHTGGVAGEYITGVADVKKRKQQALRSLSDDIDQGRVSLDMVGGGGRARRKAIKEMLKVLETSVHGLLRVVELFEARTPKGQAITAKVDGVVAEIETKGLRTVVIHSRHSIDDLKNIQGEQLAEDVYAPDGKTLLCKKGQKLLKKVRARLKKAGIETIQISTSHLVPYRGELYVQQGQEVHAGDRLTAGPVDPQAILEMKGVHGLQDYLVREIQSVYRAQGVSINDKHIETIVRQMLRKRKIRDHGDTRFLPGEIVDRFDYEDENRRIRELGGTEATADPILLGITQASLATESFLSAASFQRTTRVLTEAACEYRRDPLLGLKENVIIGRLIPAGSGMPLHRDRDINYSEDVRELVQAHQATITTAPKEPVDQLADIMQTLEVRELLSENLFTGPEMDEDLDPDMEVDINSGFDEIDLDDADELPLDDDE